MRHDMIRYDYSSKSFITTADIIDHFSNLDTSDINKHITTLSELQCQTFNYSNASALLNKLPEINFSQRLLNVYDTMPFILKSKTSHKLLQNYCSLRTIKNNE